MLRAANFHGRRLRARAITCSDQPMLAEAPMWLLPRDRRGSCTPRAWPSRAPDEERRSLTSVEGWGASAQPHSRC